MTLSERLVRLELLEKVRRVRTPEGARRYGLPVGAVIVPGADSPFSQPKLPKQSYRSDNGKASLDIQHKLKYMRTEDGAASLTQLDPKSQSKVLGMWMDDVGVDPDEASKNVVNIFNEADQSTIDSGMLWYQTAHDHARDLGRKYGYSTDQVAGLIAALSPSTGWEDNMSMADNFLHWLDEDRTISEADIFAFNNYEARRNEAAIGDYKRGKRKTPPQPPKLLSTSYAGTTIRDAFKKGDLDSTAQLLKMRWAIERPMTDPRWGHSKKMAIQSMDNMKRALNILGSKRSETAAVADRSLGGLKIRSFFNNIASPSSGRDATIDSHAFGMLLDDVTVTQKDQRYLKWSNTPAEYSVAVDIMRSALDKVNAERAENGQVPLNLQQLQAITWVVWRNKKIKAGTTRGRIS